MHYLTNLTDYVIMFSTIRYVLLQFEGAQYSDRTTTGPEKVGREGYQDLHWKLLMIADITRPCSKGARTMTNANIKDGRIYGIKFSEHFNVQLSEDQNPSICPIIDFDGMPLKTLVKLAFDSMKVKGRPAMKNMDVETLKKVYEGVVSWRVLISKEGAAQHATQVEMSDDELEKEIGRLQDRIEKRQIELDKEEE